MTYPNLPENVNSVAEIEELVEKYQIPMREKCRFFINEDYKEPMAFGIYFDGEDWIVYKNKANGERAVRYKGKSEKYAAQELWDKFLDETDSRRSKTTAGSKTSKRRSSLSDYPVWTAPLTFGIIAVLITITFISPMLLFGIIVALISGLCIWAFITTIQDKAVNFIPLIVAVVFIGVFILCLNNNNNSRHYYHDGDYYHDNNNDYYYRQGDDWYYYDDSDDLWAPYYGDSYDDFYITDTFDGSTYFDETDYYDSDNAYYYDDDDDYDSGWSDSSSSSSDWDSWDSSDTDWDSDW